MHLLRSAERVLGIVNQFTLKNTLNDAVLYENVKQFKQNHSLPVIDEQWSKVSTIISLLFAKALNINEEENPALHWKKQRNGLLRSQFELASALDLIVEANDLSYLEYNYYKKITTNSMSTKLYFKSLDIIRRLKNERIYLDFKKSINDFHDGLKLWSKFEENFFNQNNNQETKLTFDNYNDYMMLAKDQNQLIRDWEIYIQFIYANLLGYSCSSMSILGDHNYDTWKMSFDFGYSFAFAYALDQQFTNYFNESENKTIRLQFPALMYLKTIKDDKKRINLIDEMINKRYCSLTALELKSKVKKSNETLNQIKLYGQTYVKKIKTCLNQLKESDSKQTLLYISNNLLPMESICLNEN